MKKSLLFLFLTLLGLQIQAQFAGYSISRYQFNQLSINPAFAGATDYGNLEVMYFGYFTGQFELTRAIQVNLQAPFWSTDHSHWGTTFGFERNGAQIEVNLNPSYSYSVDLDIGRISFGGMLGFSFFDFDEELLITPVTDFRNFLSINGGLGIFLTSEKYFAGVSALRLFEVDFLDESRELGQAFNRENPYYLSGGFITQINDQYELKPSFLVKYSNNYLLPETGGTTLPNEIAADLALTLVINQNYFVSGFFGVSRYDDDQKLNRFGLTINLLFDNIRLSYGLQRFIRPDTNIGLPSSHLFSLGYRFVDEYE